MPNFAELIAAGRNARAQHRLDEARSLYTQAAQLCLNDQNPLAYAHTIRHVADMLLEESRYKEAKPLYEEALKLYRGNLETRVLDLANTVRPYALVNEGLTDLEFARELLQEARTLYAALRLDAGTTECDQHLARLRP